MTWRVEWNLGDKIRYLDFNHVIYAEIFESEILSICTDVKKFQF